MLNVPDHLPESDLVQGLRHGEGSWERLFVEQYSRRLLRVVAPRVRTWEDAEDVVSEVLTRVILKIDQFDPAQAGFNTWVLSIAKNAIVDYWRSGREENPVPLAPDDPAATQLLHAVISPLTPQASLRVQAVRRTLDTLSERERTVLECRLVGISYGEIAAHSPPHEGRPLTEENARQLYRRTLTKLRELLLAQPEFADLLSPLTGKEAIGPEEMA